MKMFDADKTRMIGLLYGGKYYENMLSRFHLIPERHGQTDRQNCYINIARQCADARKIFTVVLRTSGPVTYRILDQYRLI